jgi:uncharacterized membrane protein
MMRHAPLNTALARTTPDTKEGRDAWKRFQASWSLWNHMRTLTTLLACACFILALTEMGNPFAH